MSSRPTSLAPVPATALAEGPFEDTPRALEQTLAEQLEVVDGSRELLSATRAGVPSHELLTRAEAALGGVLREVA